jgi:hypothetical protein
MKQRFLSGSIGSFWVCSIAFWCGMATPAWARTVQLELGLALTGNVTQADVTARAEQLIVEQVRSTFALQSDVTAIRVYVLVNRAGQSVPMILAQVERSQWQEQPQIQRYIRYLDAGVMLLGLGGRERRATPAVHQSSLPTRYENDIAFRDD